jgi:hypothetical protein
VGVVGLFLLFRRPIWVPSLATVGYVPVMLAATLMFVVNLQCQLYPLQPNTGFTCPGGHGDPTIPMPTVPNLNTSTP